MILLELADIIKWVIQFYPFWLHHFEHIKSGEKPFWLARRKMAPILAPWQRCVPCWRRWGEADVLALRVAMILQGVDL